MSVVMTYNSLVQNIQDYMERDDPDFIAIGYTDSGAACVSGAQHAVSLGNLRRDEIYAVQCLISSWTGGISMKSVRDRAFTLMAGVEAAIRGDATLQAAVAVAQFGQTIDYDQTQTDQGAVATIRFTIDVTFNRI